MNDLLERYLSAVCSYFIGTKRKKVYNDLKKQILASASHYDELERTLVRYGHPRSVALSYGYRPLITHYFNPKYVSLFQRLLASISFLYLFFSTIYYLQQLNCLPFQNTQNIASTVNMSTTITWILSHPMAVLGSLLLIASCILIIFDMKYPVNQQSNVQWDKERLSNLPHPSHYACHYVESIIIFIFCIFFIFYGIFFTSSTILEIQNSSLQMIHLMTYFFNPFIMIILLDYAIDLTKKKFSRKYLKYTSLINLFTVVSLTFFVINSQFLKSYLLPFTVSFNYAMADIFIVSALLMIYAISLYKLIRNLKAYRCLLRKS